MKKDNNNNNKKKKGKKGCLFESDEHWSHLKIFKGNTGKTSERGLDHSDIIMGFSQHIHTIMNWTEVERGGANACF